RWYELQELLEYGSVDDVAEVFKKGGYSVNLTMSDGTSVLLIALVKSSSPDVIAYLVDNGANVNAKYDSGITVLMTAVYDDANPEIIDILLRAGADPGAKTDNGFTAIDIAEACGRSPAVIARLKEAMNTPVIHGRASVMAYIPESICKGLAYVYMFSECIPFRKL
ncbi:MAG: hypothetical protein IJQ58_00010, partial [Synergistaceae bacterium]|nr:hypothetical protein [Synergistaceae bacterium]